MKLDVRRRTVNGVYLQPTPFLVAERVSQGYTTHASLMRLIVADREQRGLTRIPETLDALRSAVLRLNRVLAKSGERVIAIPTCGYQLVKLEQDVAA